LPQTQLTIPERCAQKGHYSGEIWSVNAGGALRMTHYPL